MASNRVVFGQDGAVLAERKCIHRFVSIILRISLEDIGEVLFRCRRLSSQLWKGMRQGKQDDASYRFGNHWRSIGMRLKARMLLSALVTV